MLDADGMKKLLAAGLSAEQITIVLEVMEETTAPLKKDAAALSARRHSDASRKRRNRANKECAIDEHNGTVTGQSRDIPRTDAGHVTGKEKVSRTLPKENNNPPIVPPKAAKPKKAMIPAEWEPSPEHIAAAAKEGLSLDAAHREARKFRDYHRSKGTMFVDWMAAWRNWIRKAVEINPNLKKGQNPDRHWLADTPGYGFG